MIGNDRTTIRIPPNINKDLNRIIKKKDISKSDYIRMAICEKMYGQTGGLE